MSKINSMYDNVHKPSHYTAGRNYEPKDVIRDWGLNFNLGSAVKYVARAGRKDDIVQDLKKAQEFIQFEIDAIEAERKSEAKPKFTEPKPKFPIVLEVPTGTPTEDIIQMAIKRILGGE